MPRILLCHSYTTPCLTPLVKVKGEVAEASLKAKEMRIQVHEEVCGPHMNGHRLAKKRLRLGYYSCTMERDCIHFVQRCHKCQVHANFIHAPPTELHNQTTPRPFAVYCLDIIGRLTRRQPIGHEYILVAIDSFNKESGIKT